MAHNERRQIHEVRYEHCIAQDNARVQYGNTYIGALHVTQGPKSDTRNQDHGGPIDFVQALRFAHMDFRIASIDSAINDTCRWIFNTKQYLRWRDPRYLYTHHGLLWVKGKPGCGKSTVMRCAFEHANSNYRDVVVSFFFNARGYSLEKSVEGMYRSLLAQLIAKVPDLRQKFPSHVPSSIERQGWPIQQLKSYLSVAGRSLKSHGPVTFYIDALDECNEGDIRHAIELFEELGNTCFEGGNVRICLASRYYPNITTPYLEEVRLDEQPQHDRDILVYVHQKLKITDQRLQDWLAREIRDRSSGVFLWVVLVVRSLKRAIDQGSTRSELSEMLGTVPTEVESLLAEILQNADTRLVAATQWVLFAKRPLKSEQLYFAIRTSSGKLTSAFWSCGEVSREAMGKYILAASRGLVELVTHGRSTSAQFVHESVREYLLSHGLVSMDPSLNGNVIGLSNARLAQWCKTHVQLAINLRSKVQTYAYQADEEAFSNDFPFLRYAWEAVFHHLDIAYHNGAFILSSLSTFPVEAWVELGNQSALMGGDSLSFSSSALVFLLLHNEAYGLAKALLQESSPSVSDVASGNNTVATTNVSKTTWSTYDPNARCGGLDLLSHAVTKHQEDIVAILINHGADVSVDDGYLLLELIQYGIPNNIVKLLLEGGAPVNRRYPDGHTALTVVLETFGERMGRRPLSYWVPNSHITEYHTLCDVVKLLLIHGADVNAVTRFGRTALSIASQYGYDDLIKLLVKHGANPNPSHVATHVEATLSHPIAMTTSQLVAEPASGLTTISQSNSSLDAARRHVYSDMAAPFRAHGAAEGSRSKRRKVSG